MQIPRIRNPDVGVDIELAKTDEGKVIWFNKPVRSIEVKNENAHELAIYLLGGKPLPHFLKDIVEPAIEESYECRKCGRLIPRGQTIDPQNPVCDNCRGSWDNP